MSHEKKHVFIRQLQDNYKTIYYTFYLYFSSYVLLHFFKSGFGSTFLKHCFCSTFFKSGTIPRTPLPRTPNRTLLLLHLLHRHRFALFFRSKYPLPLHLDTKYLFPLPSNTLYHCAQTYPHALPQFPLLLLPLLALVLAPPSFYQTFYQAFYQPF